MWGANPFILYIIQPCMSYDKSAKYYDLFGEKPDIEYYKTLGLQNGTALEIGVGTARIALELARAGVKVYGIDNSDEMLKIARSKCAAEPDSVQKRIVLENQDMRDFHLPRTFPLIYVPSSGFSHCITTEDQVTCLNCIYNHLDKKGLLVVDIDLPSSSYTNALKLIDRKEVDDTEVVRWISNSPNYANQLLDIVLIFEVYRNQKLTERIIESSTVSLIYKRELLLLLDKAHFTVDNIYGDFQKSEEVTDLLIVEARKP